MTRPAARRERLTNPGTVAFGWLMEAVVAGTAVALLRSPGSQDSFLGRVSYLAILLPAGWVVWRVGIHPAVVLGADAVQVRNPLVTHVVPLRMVSDVGADPGLHLRVGDRRIGAWAFSSSAIGRRRIRAAQAAAASWSGGAAPATDEQVVSRVSLGLLPLAFAAALYVLAAYLLS